MIRRRRPTKEIHFSFDSFLDVVANVVGIILRLILVAWVGARSYKAVLPPAAPEPPPIVDAADLPDPKDPLSAEVERQRRELADIQAQVLEQLQQWRKVQQDSTLTAEELARITARTAEVAAEKEHLERSARDGSQSAHTAALSMADIRERTRRVMEELEALRKLPPAKQTLRYRTPVSHPLTSEELLFECRRGRVTLIDIGAFMDEIRRNLSARDRQETLRSMGRLADMTAPAGAFRLRYVFEVLPGMDGADCSWEVEPLNPDRGETLEAALAPRSEFRRIIEGIEPAQTAVTFCVYPDSFALYRRLRDYLHERDIVVAGRALPEGARISASRHGTASRGQ